MPITAAHPLEQKKVEETANQLEIPKTPKKSQRVGQRKPKRDPVEQQ